MSEGKTVELKLLQGYKVLMYFVSSAVKSCDSQSIKLHRELGKDKTTNQTDIVKRYYEAYPRCQKHLGSNQDPDFDLNKGCQ